MITINDAETYVEGVTPAGKYRWEGEGSSEGFAAWIFYELGKIPEDGEAEEACDRYVRSTLWCDECGAEITLPGYVQHCIEGDYCGDQCLHAETSRRLGR